MWDIMESENVILWDRTVLGLQSVIGNLKKRWFEAFKEKEGLHV